MIKTTAMFSAHAIHELLRNTLIFFIVIFIALFFWLKVGLQADSLVFGKYKIEKLYIKLDKKFTLSAEKIIIPKSKKKPTFDNLDETFDKTKYLFTFFDVIDLKNIIFDNNHIDFTFRDNNLSVISDDYEISGSIERSGKTLIADISYLTIKKENIHLTSNVRYNLTHHTLEAEGNFEAYQIKGSFSVKKSGDNIDFKLKSKRFTDLKTLIHRIPMHESIESWIVDKVQAEHYTLNSIEGTGSITDTGFKVDFENLKANALLEGVKIYYQKGLAPILASSAIIDYNNRGLYFDLKNPFYEKRSLANSKVSLTNLGEKTMLVLDLHVITPIDDVLQKVLRSYKLDIPVKHEGTASSAIIKIDIPLGKNHEHKKVLVTVDVNVTKGEVWYKNIKLPIESATVIFNNKTKDSLVVDAVLTKGMVEIGKTKLPVQSGKGQYTKSMVTLKDVHLKSLWYDGKVSGPIDLKSKKAKFSLALKKMSIGDKDKFIVVKNKALDVSLNYVKNIKITVPSLDLKIENKKDTLVINVASLKKIKPFIRNMDINFDDGNIKIIRKNRGKYTFKGVLKRKACFFYDKNRVCHTRIPYYGSIGKYGLNFYAFNKKLYYNSKKSRIKLNNINIDLKKLLEVHTKNQKRKKSNSKLVILGKKSKIRYDQYELLTDSYDIEISPKGNIKATGSLNGDIVKFAKQGKVLSLEAFRVQDKMLHPLIGFDGLKEGRYTFKKSGNPDKVMKGEIIVEGGIMSNFKAYNNTLALLNTIPAIATLSNPGFSEQGFQIVEGLVEYRMIGTNKIIFDSIYIKGKSSTIVGKGKLDILKNTIQMNLAIQTARELGKFVGNIPLLGYILMGKDKSLTLGLKVTGALNQPTVDVSTAEEILTLPLQLIKRVLESPAHIINE